MNKIAILKHVFASLDDNEVKYCVLRNYDFLIDEREPNKKSERSVDLVVSKEDYKKFHQVLTTLNFKKRKKPSFSLSHVPYYFIEDGEVISFDVQLGGVHWNDMCYLNESFIVKNKVKKSFFYVPSEEDTFVMLLVHSILGKRRFKPEYKKIILELAPSVDKEYVLNRLSSVFYLSEAERLFNYVKKNNFKKILTKKYFLIFSFITKSFSNFSIFIKLFFRWIKWKKIGASYPLITFIGPDGSGKSTMSEMLKECLQQRGKKVVKIYTGRGRGQLLPIRRIGNMYKSKERKTDISKRPSSSTKRRRRFIYTIMAPIFTFDLLLRYYLTILPKRKIQTIVITDRYCSDIWLMENVPIKFRKFLLSLFPRPTITFYFYNSAEELHVRRPEESITGLNRQLKLFNNLVPYMKAIPIKSDGEREGFHKVSKETISYLLDCWY